MSMQSLKKIGKKVLKLEHRYEAQSIFDLHQGPQLCCFRTKLAHLQSHTTPLRTNAYAKFEENW